MSPEERGKYLEGCETLADVHENGAHEGQTRVRPPLSHRCRCLMAAHFTTPDTRP